jgi:hypothetical protein
MERLFETEPNTTMPTNTTTRKRPRVRTYYDEDYDSVQYGLFTSDEDRLNCKTQQQFKDECDIHRIVARYALDGVWSHTNPLQPVFDVEGELDTYDDHQVNMNRVRKAQETFESLPAEVRRHYGNEPYRFFDAVKEKDPNLQRFGLMKPPAMHQHLAGKPPETPPESEA